MKALVLAGFAAVSLAGCVVVPVDPGPPYAAVAPQVLVGPGPIVVRPHHRHHLHRHYGDGYRYRRYRY